MWLMVLKGGGDGVAGGWGMAGIGSGRYTRFVLMS